MAPHLGNGSAPKHRSLMTWDCQLRKMAPSHAQRLGHILGEADQWKKLMAAVPKDYFTDDVTNSDRRFTSDDIGLIDNAARSQANTTAFEVLVDEWGTLPNLGGKRHPTMGLLLELLVFIDNIRAACYVAKDMMGLGEITDENKKLFLDLHRPQKSEGGSAAMTTSNPTAPAADVDFSAYNSAIEEEMANIDAEDFDNSSFLSTPVPPEDTFPVHRVPFAYLQRITKNFPEDDKSMFVGKGGFAKVFLGITENRRFKLAVKKLDPEASRLTATHRDRTFNYEVAELSRLKHPNLIEILGYSNDVAESVCLIYPYFVNGNLEDRLMMKRTPHQQLMQPDAPVAALDVCQRMNILLGTATGLNFIHTQPKPLIHRDIKTPNILLDDQERPKLADFGLLRHAAKNDTETGIIQGTTRYMAPEAMRGDLSVKIDVYSFGLVLLEVVSGLPSYDDKKKEDLITLFQDGLDEVDTQAERADFVAKLTDDKACWPPHVAERLVWGLVQDCFKSKNQRPSMEEVLGTLTTLNAEINQN